MLALFRNPLLRLLGRLWWLPALAILVAALGFGGEQGLRRVGVGFAAYLAAIAGMVGAAWTHGACAALCERLRHRFAHHRFLCPDCLHFGGFHFACGACGKEVEAFPVHTNGVYVNDCPHCRALLLSRDGRDGRGVRAYCERCEAHYDRDVYHQRQVRVLATLLSDDLTSLCQAIGAQEKKVQGIGCAWDDDGVRLTYALNLYDLPAASNRQDRPNADPVLPPTHAGREVESIWLDGAGFEPQKLALEIGEVADRFLRQARLTEAQRQALTVCVRQDQDEVDSAVQHVLETRFGTVKYGVTPADFLRDGAQARAEATAPPPPALRLTAPATGELTPTPQVQVEQWR